MAQVIAVTAPAALALFGVSFHESFHADSRQRPMAVTDRSGQNPPQRRRNSIWSDRTVEQVVALPNRAVNGIRAAPLRGTAGPAPASASALGPAAARRARAFLLYQQVQEQMGAFTR